MNFKHLVVLLIVIPVSRTSEPIRLVSYQTNNNYFTGNFRALTSAGKGQLVATYHESVRANRIIKTNAAIIGLERQNTHVDFNLTLDIVQWNLSSITMSYDLGNGSRSSYLNLCYILVAELTFMQNVIVQSDQSITTNKLSVGSGHRQQHALINIKEKNVDPTHQITILTFLKGFWTSNPDKQTEIHLSARLVNASAYEANITTNSNNTVSSVTFFTLVIDQSMLLASNGNESAVYETIRLYNSTNSVNLHVIPSRINYQMLAGIVSLHLKQDQSLDFDLISFRSVTCFSYVSITYLFVPLTFCLHPAFRNPYENFCIMECQPFYNFKKYRNGTYNYCYRCHEDCKTCNNFLPESCQSCDQSKVLINGRCECSVGWGKDPDGICIICDPQCQRCQNRPDYCIQCKQTTFRNVSNGQCVCPPGYLDNGDVCMQCSQIYPGCLTCNQQRCLSCNIDSHFMFKDGRCQCDGQHTEKDGKCVPCSQKYAGCKQCADGCLVCQPEYTLQDGVCRCQDKHSYLSDNGCMSCPQQCQQCISATHCLSCKPYYELSGIRCQGICGDNHIVLDQCQDGNSINGDGCSDSCQKEQGFKCRTMDGMSQCSPTGTLSASMLHISKDPYSNKVLVTLQSQHNHIDWADTVRNSMVTAVKTDKDIITVSLEYNESLQYQVVVLDIVPTDRLFAMLGSRLQMMVHTDRPAHHHPPTIYTQAKTYNILSIVMCSLLMLIIVYSTYTGGLTGIELLWPYQTLAMAVVSVQRHAVVVYPSEWLIISRIDLVLLVYFTMTVVLLAVRHLQAQQLHQPVTMLLRHANKILSSILFSACMFCVPSAVYVASLELAYIKNHQMAGIYIASAILLAMLIYLTVRLRNSQDKPIERRYVILQTVKRVVVAALSGIFNYTGWAHFSSLASQFLFTVYTVWKSPYSGKKNILTLSFDVLCCFVWATVALKGNMTNIMDWTQLAMLSVLTLLTVLRMAFRKKPS